MFFQNEYCRDWISCAAQSCLGDSDLCCVALAIISLGYVWHQIGGKLTATLSAAALKSGGGKA